MSSTHSITETMTQSVRRDDSISLHSMPSSGSQRLSTESRPPSRRQTSYSQRLRRGIGSESKRQPQVLIANAVLQVPIWGFPMTYGIFQDFLLKNSALKGSKSSLGVIGTTSNGIMYLSMPILFSLLSRRFIHLRRHAAIAGVLIQCISFLLSAFATQVWQLVVTQGVLAALGATLVYSPTTLSLSENFTTNSRAVAYGVVLSAKNITGTSCPFLIQYLLNHHGFRYTMIVWTAIVGGMGLICSLLMPMHAFAIDSGPTAYRSRKIPWAVLRHRTIWITAVATMMQSSGYGLPQTYLSSYASSIAELSATSSTLLITLFNAPGIISSSFFGFLSDNKRFPLSATSVAFISAFSSAMAAFFLWGFSSTSSHSLALLILFSITYGFFAGGYSATWGGSIKDMEREAAERNEALDTGIVYGLLNGARGIGYVSGGLAGVQLLKAGQGQVVGRWAYGTEYGPVILYTGLSTFLGGWGIFFRWWKLLR